MAKTKESPEQPTDDESRRNTRVRVTITAEAEIFDDGSNFGELGEEFRSACEALEGCNPLLRLEVLR